MELQTISQVSKTYGVSVRMLRYYEEEELIESKRKEDYAYRVYDETAIKRLQQIIILRKLQIPVKQISAILDNPYASETVEIFKQNIGELNDEITALSTIRSILKDLVDIMQDKISINPHIDLTSDTSIIPLVESLSFTKNKIKENLSMEDLNKANETLNRLKQPEIKTFQMQHDEFLFLGKEYPLNSPDFGAVWGDFFDSGGMDKIVPYINKEYWMMEIYHNINPEQEIFFIGSIVNGVDKVPDGFTLRKFPAREFIVVTTEWVSTWDKAMEIGHGQCLDYAKTVQIPEGYIRYDGPGSQIKLIERENSVSENGNRYEVWVPIKKQ